MKSTLSYIGIDVDDKAYHVSVFNPLDESYFDFKAGPSPELLLRSFRKHAILPDQVRIVYEATYIGFSLQRIKRQPVLIAKSLLHL